MENRGGDTGRTTLAAEVAAGRASVEDVDAWVEEWHDARNEERPIHEMFGITRKVHWPKRPGLECGCTQALKEAN